MSTDEGFKTILDQIRERLPIGPPLYLSPGGRDRVDHLRTEFREGRISQERLIHLVSELGMPSSEIKMVLETERERMAAR